MVILSRGVPATVESKDLRKSTPLSLSDNERNNYALAAQSAGMKLSAWLRLAADEKIAREENAAILAVTLYICPLGHVVGTTPGLCIECGGELWERRYLPEGRRA